MYYDHGMWGMWGPGWIGMILFWALLILGIVSLVRALGWSGRDRSTDPSQQALEVLRTRYARGDIDKQEFEAKRQDILSS